MAMWKAEVELQDGTNNRDFLYFSSADAKAMTRPALREAQKKAAERAKSRFKRKGIKVRVIAVMCVG